MGSTWNLGPRGRLWGRISRLFQERDLLRRQVIRHADLLGMLAPLFLLRPLADQDGFGNAFMRHIYYPTYSRLDGLLAWAVSKSIRMKKRLWSGSRCWADVRT